MLNNILSILTTENEIITNFLTIPTIPIEIWLSFIILKTLLKINTTKKQNFYYILFLSLASLVTKFIVPTPFNVFINYILMFIIIKFIFKLNIIKTILFIITPTIIFALIGTLVLNPFLRICNINSIQLNIIPLYRLTYLFCIYFICFIVSFIIGLLTKQITFSANLLNSLNAKEKNIIVLNLILALITIATQILITFYYINIYSIMFTLLNFLSLLAYFSISFYSLTKTMKLQTTTQNLESAENYNATLSYLYDNVKAFQHDFTNMIFIIGGYIEANDIDGLKQYYLNLEKDCLRVSNVTLLNPNLINNSGIYNLLIAKYKKAHDENVDIKLEFFFDFNKLHMPIYEFSRILGILLDNAIEAAKDTVEKSIKIFFRDSSRNQTQIISIENSYTNKDVDTNKIFEKGITEKANHTGMGLWEVNQILKRHKNTKLITTKDNNYFKQTLEIYY